MHIDDFSFFIRQDPVKQMAWQWIEADACQRRLSPKYRLYYRTLRPFMPVVVRQLLQNRREWQVEDGWFEPRAFIDALVQMMRDDAPARPLIHPWPLAAKFAFVLTHDVETDQGFKNIPAVAAMEEELGFRSSWNLVPYKYKIDHGLVSELQSRGFEIGIHGFNHDGQLFLSRKKFNQRAGKINQAIERFGAVGFRSPMVHRNLSWLQALNIEYDSSCFDVDPYQAMNGGVGSIWPFVAGRFVELPYTLPQDHTLFVVRDEIDDRIWVSKLEFLVRHRGMALMLTHPDYLMPKPRLDIYRRFLQRVKERTDYWHALPGEVARWWREREQFSAVADQQGAAPAHSLPGNMLLANFVASGAGFQIEPVRNLAQPSTS